MTTKDHLLIVDKLIAVILGARTCPPYHPDAKLTELKKKLEEEIMFEEVTYEAKEAT